MNKKICCKNCKYLNFYDTYFCNNKDIDYRKILIKNDIEQCKCKLYSERKGKFWIDGEW